MIKFSGIAVTQGMMAGALALMLSTTLQANEAPSRIVSVGGAVTEIVYALEEEDRLVARDTTSNFPLEARDLPNVGYIRRLSAEGVLSVNPDLILSESGAGPLETMELLREAAIPVAEINDGFTREAISEKILTVAEILGVREKGEALAAETDAAIAKAIAKVDTSDRPKVLFILSTAGGRVMAAGSNTSADAIIALAGGENAAVGFEGFKPMTDEAIATSGAEVILMMARHGEEDASNDALRAHPAIGQTPAVMNDAVIRMDGMLLLGFSVRTAQAISELADALAGVES